MDAYSTHYGSTVICRACFANITSDPVSHFNDSRGQSTRGCPVQCIYNLGPKTSQGRRKVIEEEAHLTGFFSNLCRVFTHNEEKIETGLLAQTPALLRLSMPSISDAVLSDNVQEHWKNIPKSTEGFTIYVFYGVFGTFVAYKQKDCLTYLPFMALAFTNVEDIVSHKLWIEILENLEEKLSSLRPLILLFLEYTGYPNIAIKMTHIQAARSIHLLRTEGLRICINQKFLDIAKEDVQCQAWKECLKEIDRKRFQAVFSQLPTTYNLDHGPPTEALLDACNLMFEERGNKLPADFQNLFSRAKAINMYASAISSVGSIMELEKTIPNLQIIAANGDLFDLARTLLFSEIIRGSQAHKMITDWGFERNNGFVRHTDKKILVQMFHDVFMTDSIYLDVILTVRDVVIKNGFERDISKIPEQLLDLAYLHYQKRGHNPVAN